MAFELPPIKDLGINIPSFSFEECAGLPSTTLTSLANNMASVQSELNVKSAQLKARARKLSGDASFTNPEGGRNTIETSVSISKVKTSMQSTINPVASTGNVLNNISETGSNLLTNPTSAGTTNEAVQSATSKLQELSKGIL